MTKPTLTGLAFYYALLSAYLILAPHAFYDTVPGVAATGPFNGHFARDVGFAFLVSAVALFIGTRLNDRCLALFGVAFPALHGLYHLASSGHHAFPGEGAALLDLAANAGLPALALALVARLKGGAA